MNKLTMHVRRWVMPCGVVVGMALGFWNVHVDAQQVAIGNINEQAVNGYVNDVCARLRAAGQSSSASSFSSGSSSSGGSLASVGGLTRVTTLAVVSPAALTTSQSDLLTRCNAIQQGAGRGDNTPITQITPSDFNAFKLDAALFNDASDASLARLRELRQSRSTATASTLDLRYNDSPLLALSNASHRGGGASADDLASQSPWGVWGRINRTQGDKGTTTLSGPLDLTHTDYTLGIDHRSGSSVLGLSVGLRNANLDFGNNSERGGMDSRTTTVSAYASSYVKGDLYVDAIVNYGFVSYDTTRHIFYDEFGTPINRYALGSADGKTLSISGSLGYDLAHGGFTLTPSLGYTYLSAKIDPFAESGADGLDLAFSEQSYKSSTMRLQLSSSYALNTSHAVILPYVRVAMIRELKDEVDTFGVRFTDDPDGTAGIPITVEALDDLYYRWALGVSAQLPHDLSGYLDYQRVSGFQSVSLWSASLGVRKQF